MIGIHPKYTKEYKNIKPEDCIGMSLRWDSWNEEAFFVVKDYKMKFIYGWYYSKEYPDGKYNSFSIFDGISYKIKPNHWLIVKEPVKFKLSEELFDI